MEKRNTKLWDEKRDSIKMIVHCTRRGSVRVRCYTYNSQLHLGARLKLVLLIVILMQLSFSNTSVLT